MAVYRVHKTKDFTVMANTHLRDKELSLRAKGLLSVMLMLPDDWKYSVSGLTSLIKEGKSTVTSTLKELEKAGYVKVSSSHNKHGKFEYVYDVFETPNMSTCDDSAKPQVESRAGKPCTVEPYTVGPCTVGPQTVIPGMEGPCTVEPLTVERTLLSTKEQSTEEPSTKEPSTESTKGTKARGRARRFEPPTVEDIRAYCQQRGNDVDPQRFFDYFDASGWVDSQGKPVRNWKQKVITWEGAGRQTVRRGGATTADDDGWNQGW